MTEAGNVKVLAPSMRAGGRIRALVPETFEDVQRLAKMAVASGLFKGDRKDDDTTKLAKATMAIMQGLEVGLPPMQAVQCIAVINGKCLIFGDAVPGLLWAAGFKLHQTITGEGDDRTATCTITRPSGEVIARTFSVADAKKAKLWDERQTIKKQWDGKWEEKPNDAPWFRFPDRMLGYRALGFASKDGASDVTRGLYIREEYDELEHEPRDITPKLALAVPDIPDAHPAPVPAAQATTGEEKAQFLEALETALVLAKTPDDLGEVWVSNEDQAKALGVEDEANELFEIAEKKLTD